MVISRAGSAADSAGGVSIVVEPGDSVAESSPAQWAISELSEALTSRTIVVHRCQRLAQAAAGDLCIVAAGPDSPLGTSTPRRNGSTHSGSPRGPWPSADQDFRQTRCCWRAATTSEDLSMRCLELADRVRHATQPLVVVEPFKTCCRAAGQCSP